MPRPGPPRKGEVDLDLAPIRRMLEGYNNETRDHWPGCWRVHIICAIYALIWEVEFLRGLDESVDLVEEEACRDTTRSSTS